MSLSIQWYLFEICMYVETSNKKSGMIKCYQKWWSWVMKFWWDLLKSFSLKECIYHLKFFFNLLRVVFDMINIKIKIQENIKTWFTPCVRFGPKCKSENDLFSVDSVTSTVLILLVSSRRWALDVIFTNYFQFFCSSQNSQEQTFWFLKSFPL